MKVHTFALIILLTVVSFSAHTQTKKGKPESKALKGYLIDKMCGSKMAEKSPDQAMDKASKHTKVCALEEGCAASGYGLMMNGKWIPFDEKGNKKATEYLEKTKAESHLFVAVSGTMTADKISVLSIKESKEKN